MIAWLTKRLVGIASAGLALLLSAAPAVAADAAEAFTAADAVRAAIATRLGVEVTVAVESIDVQGEARIFREAHPAPTARLGRPIRFALVTNTGAIVPATATVSVSGAIVVPTRSVARGESLASEDLTESAQVMTGLPLRRLPRLTELIGSRALRALPVGEAIHGNAVALRRKVEPGDPVTVVVASGAVQITAAFVAADGGETGKVIRVVNPETRRFLRGRVLPNGTVEVIDGR
jgi:flagella basal body P-ring formation protein FlgA